MKFTLECCVDSVESAIEGKIGGADRLELCSNLIIGGTTPTSSLFQLVRSRVDMPIHVLIRPRVGDFCYSNTEFELIRYEVLQFRKLGADGIVIGCLTPEGALDVEKMKQLKEIAGEIKITLHRAFDMAMDPIATLEVAKTLGIHTILTSGQKNTCSEGKELIKKLVDHSENTIDIMVGAGLKAGMVKTFYKDTGAVTYHTSGKVDIPSQMTFRNPDISMGSSSFNEYTLLRTHHQNIRAIKEEIEELEKEEASKTP